MARKTAKKAPTKKFKGNEAFIPIDEVPEDDDSDAGDFEAMALPRDVSPDESDIDDDFDEGVMEDDGDDVDDIEGDDYMDDEDEMEEEDELGDGKKRSSWGKKLGDYYDDGSEDYSDADDLNDRIAEANRIAQELYADVDDEDAEIEDMVEQEDTSISATALDAILDDLSGSLKAQSAKIELPKDFFTMSDSDKLEYMESEHPEFIALLKEFRDKVAIVNDQVLTLVNNDSGVAKLCTKDGMEYLDIRNELMLMYVTYLSYYLLLKTHGIPVENHPVIKRLLEIRVMLDKARPIESRLQFEINKLLDESDTTAGGKSTLRPRPDLLEVDAREQDGVYRPSAQLPLLETDSYARYQKKLQRAEKVVSGRRLLEQAREEQEDGADDLEDGYNSKKATKMIKALLERERYEMEHMRRLPMNKMAKKELREFQKHQRNKQGGIMLDDLSNFATEAMSSGPSKRNMTVGLNAAAQAMRQDILETEKLRASDAYYKPHGSKRSNKLSGPSAPQRVAPPVRKQEFDDELSRMKRHESNLKASIKEQRTEGSKRKYEHIESEGKRVAGADILRNKGLTRKRKKTAGNARVSNRAKFEKKVVAQRSKVSAVRSETPGYSGESTGINAKKKKSVTF
ncbi:Sas10 C-terminal domain-containing, putative [Babesia ovis]|uniref:Sas10 C-terminal domain-containing, putative n=1 Tax=Babesia ovis TaxID=5869 RepID=A0A9W5T9Y0_BABOV|nr:Sas10 C-terminal domain-containing, putative [Babesia ovis]